VALVGVSMGFTLLDKATYADFFFEIILPISWALAEIAEGQYSQASYWLE
jgi:hypothetical protein